VVEIYVDNEKPIRQLTKGSTPRRHKKTEQMNYKNSPRQN